MTTEILEKYYNIISRWDKVRSSSDKAFIYKYINTGDSYVMSPAPGIGVGLSKNGNAQLYAGSSLVSVDNNLNSVVVYSENTVSIRSKYINLSSSNILFNNNKLNLSLFGPPSEDNGILVATKTLNQLMSINLSVIIGEPVVERGQTKVLLSDLFNISYLTEGTVPTKVLIDINKELLK